MLQESLAKQLGAAAVRVVAVDEVSGAERDQALAEAEATMRCANAWTRACWKRYRVVVPVGAAYLFAAAPLICIKACMTDRI